MDSQLTDLPKVFIAYSHNDKEWMNRIKRGLDVLSYAKKLSPWSDVCITAGSDWRRQIKKALKEADAAIIIISDYLLTSEFVQEEEVPKLLERHKNEKMPIIPVPARASNWEQFDWLYRLQSYVKSPRPLASLSEADIDPAITQICNQVVRSLTQIRPRFESVDAIRERLRVLCVFPRPIGSGRGSEQDLLADLDLRTEWNSLAEETKSRNTPIALLRMRPPTREHLRDELRNLANAGNYPHVVHISARQSGNKILFEDEVGLEHKVSMDDLAQDFSAMKYPLPLLVCRLVKNLSTPSIECRVSQNEGIHNIIMAPEDLRLHNESKSWVSLYNQLAHKDPIDKALEQAFENSAPTLISSSQGPLCEQSFTSGSSYVNEGVAVKRWPIGSGHFVGRSNELIEIARGIPSKRVTLITGMIGMGGKTLALEAVFRNAWRFPGRVVIFDADYHQSDDELLTYDAVVSRFSEHLDLDGFLGIHSDPKAYRPIQMQKLMEEGDYLFVFLSAELFIKKNRNEFNKILDLFVTRGSNCHTLIEAKQHIQLPDLISTSLINHISLKPLGTSDAICLTKLLARDYDETAYIAKNEEYCKALAELSGGYPKILAMALALAKTDPIREIIDKLQDHRGQIAQQIDSLVDQAVKCLNEDARRMLGILQIFPAMSISALSLNAIELAFDWEDITLEVARRALVNAYLIQFDPKSQRYHWDKIVHEHAFQININTDDKFKIDLELIKIYSGHTGVKDGLSTVLSQGESAINILAVVNRMMKNAKKAVHTPEHMDQSNLRSIAYDIARQAQRRGLEYEGRPLLQSVMNICWQSHEQDLQDKHAEVAALVYDIASVEQAQGDYDGAKKHYKQSLGINEDADDQFGIARSYHGIGRLYHDIGKYDQARKYYEDSMKLRQNGLNSGDSRENNRTIAQLKHELARLAHDEGEYSYAERLHYETLRIREKDAAGDERGLAATKYELGRLAQDRGKWHEAERWYKESEGHWHEGKYFIGVGIVQHALASLLSVNGQTDKARLLFNMCLEIQRRTGDKRGVAATFAQLGMLEMNNLEVAERYLADSIEMQKETNYFRGEVIAALGLALVKLKQQKFNDAKNMINELLDRCREKNDIKIIARAELLMGTLLLKESSVNSSQVFKSLFAALETALRMGDKCTEAVAKIRLGQYMSSINNIDTTLENDGMNILSELLNRDVDSVDDVCNLLSINC
jgi:tetratricopeptide (TPR) repeat protein